MIKNIKMNSITVPETITTTNQKGGMAKRTYRYALAESNKRSKDKVNTFKLRVTGNSVVISVPEDVLRTLHAEPGDEIQYITVKVNDGEKEVDTVLISKVTPAETPKHLETEELDEMLDDYFDKYDSVMRSLADM
jgi:antitoxin component of MazEF toxin-antitoxin module